MRRPAARGGRDRGSISILSAVGLTGILLIIGLSVDAGGRLRAAAHADDLAAAAARTGGQQIDLASAIPGGVKQLDKPAAIQAATKYLQDQGGTDIVVEVSVNLQQITVSFTFTYQTKVLWIVNVNQLTVKGTATATLLNTA